MSPTAPRAGYWETLHGMVKGAGKKYSQDSYVVRTSDDGRAVVLAVADGHGSAPHFRSDLGSRWAVQVFADRARGFAERAVLHGSAERHWGMLRAEAETLPRHLVHRWREKALLHDSNSPARGGAAHRTPGPHRLRHHPRRRRGHRPDGGVLAAG